MGKMLSFVIPCYRSADIMPDVVGRLARYFDGGEYGFEVILVNDCSPDGTFGAIARLCAADSRIKGVGLSRNFGQHAAILAGLRQVSGDIVVCLDDDGQTPPEQAHKLIEQVEGGHDAAMVRYAEKKHGFFRNLGSRVNDRMARSMVGKPKKLFLSSYVAMKRFVADEICAYTFPYPYISGLLLRATHDIVNVDIDHEARRSGTSGYTFSKLAALWFNGFTNFSIKPLRTAIVLGVVIAIAGFIEGIYSVVTKLMNPETPLGWASMVSVTAFIGGIVLVVLGLTGEYIGRIYMGLNQQPQYVIREKINLDKHGEKTE
jgi:undecaprenyl-phosphate 4-deoxy-4-formamido-L-arabinose transferase